MKWYDSVELPHGTLNLSGQHTWDEFIAAVEDHSRALNPGREPFVIRLREATAKKLNLSYGAEIETRAGKATVLAR